MTISENRTLLRLAVTLTILITCCGRHVCSAQTFAVKGNLSFTGINRNGKPGKVVRSSFTIYVKDRLWAADIERLGDPSTFAVTSHFASCDGTNYYSIANLSESYRQDPAIMSNILEEAYGKGMSKKLKWTTQGNGLNKATGTIFPGDIPRFERDGAAFLWLAYGSHYYTANFGTNEAPRMWFYDLREEFCSNYLTDATWQLAKPEPQLPLHVDFKKKGFTYIKELDGQLKEYALPPPYDQGFIYAVFESLSRTNSRGLEFPLKSRLTGFAPGKDTNHLAILESQGIFEAQTKTILTEKELFDEMGKELVDRLSFTPTLAVITLLTDYRLSTDRQYLAAPKQFLGETDSSKFKQFAQSLHESTRNVLKVQHVQIDKKRHSIIIVLVFFFIMLLALLIKKKNLITKINYSR